MPVTLDFGSFNIGSGLLEISALTTLIGSATGEALILGNRGAAGLAWASMSAFGSLSIVKGCVSGASSGWIREFLLVRSKWSDMAVGMQLHLSWNSRLTRRSDEEAVGIICHSVVADENNKTNKASIYKNPPAWRGVYAFDHSTSNTLQGAPASNSGSPLRIFTYGNYPFVRNLDNRFQTISLLLSSVKLIEFYAIWTSGNRLVAYMSVIPWTYFVVVAACLHLHTLSYGQFAEYPGTVDILAGQLPTTKKEGGSRKVVLGAAENLRHSVWWRISWAIGAVVSTASLLLTYIILGSAEDKTVGYIWAAFQALWLASRLLFYYFADPADTMAHRMLVDRPWETTPLAMKNRVLDLVLGLSRFQAHVHPRGLPSYEEEMISSRQLSALLIGQTLLQYYPLGDKIRTNLSGVQVTVVAVIGDVVLSSAAWTLGSKLSSMDLYDSCIVVFKVTSESSLGPGTPTSTTIAVPSARVLSGKPLLKYDVETSVAPMFVPKGSSNAGVGLVWWYWIPCAPGVWLQLCSEDLKFLGQRKGNILTDEDLTKRLAAGDLSISLSHADKVEEIVDHSRRGGDMFMSFFR